MGSKGRCHASVPSSRARLAAARESRHDDRLSSLAVIRRFLADSAVYAVAAVLSQGIGLLLFPFLAHHFTPREYGVIDILTLVAIIVTAAIKSLWQTLQEASERTKRALASQDIEEPAEQFYVLVECADEAQQRELLARFENEGLHCQAKMA